MTVRRWSVGIGLVLGVLVGAGLAGAPAGAAAGFRTELSGLPERFTGGDEVRTVAAVVSRTGGGCVRVRWSMLLQVRGIRLDQVRVERVEETGPFPLEVRVEGDGARLTDRRLDPGTLCPGRTVTARYRLAFAEDVGAGRITLAAEAYDPELRLLARQSATRRVLGAGGVEAVPSTVEPTPTGAATDPGSGEASDEPTAPADEPTEEPVAGSAGEPVADVPVGAAPRRAVAGSGGFGAVQAAFLLGGALLFVGVGLLLRLRQLTRQVDPVGGDVAARAPWRPARR